MNVVLYVCAWVALFVCSGKYMHTGIYYTRGLLFLTSRTLPAPCLPVTLMCIIQGKVRFSKCISKNNNAYIGIFRKLHVHSNNSSCICVIWQSAKQTLCRREHVLTMQLMLKLSHRKTFTHGRLWKVTRSSVLDQVACSSLKNVKRSLFNTIFVLTTYNLWGRGSTIGSVLLSEANTMI